MKKSIFIMMMCPLSLVLKANCQIVPEVILSTASKTAESIYKPVNMTDPVLPSNIYNSQTTNKKLPSQNKEPLKNVNLSTATINNFILVGIVQFSNKKEALLKDASGALYIVKDGKIYDNKKNVLKGIKANIKGKQVTIIDEKNKEKPVELFIKE